MSLSTSIENWLTSLDSFNVRIRDQLNPPADNKEISDFESIIGHQLHQDHKRLYRYANGQISPYDVNFDTDGPNNTNSSFILGEGESVGSLFGGYEFLSLQQGQIQWQQQKDILEYYVDHRDVTVREGDFVRAHFLNINWIPLAYDWGGNYVGIDMDPPKGGNPGQVILYGPDEEERRVLGTCIGDFLNRLAEVEICDWIIEDHRFWFSLTEQNI